jgi:hypothetical protein
MTPRCFLYKFGAAYPLFAGFDSDPRMRLILVTRGRHFEEQDSVQNNRPGELPHVAHAVTPITEDAVAKPQDLG